MGKSQTMMQYKGYFGHVVFDDESDLFHGEVAGIRDVVTFQGKSVDDLRKAFEESVDDYLEFCRQRGESPEKPLSGRFVLRIPPDLHRRICTLASASGQSLNAWVTSRLEQEVVEFSGPVTITTYRALPKGNSAKKARKKPLQRARAAHRERQK